MPRRFSSARICRLTAGCVTPRRSAACEKLFFSTTAQKAASCRVSISIDYAGPAVQVIRGALRIAGGNVDEAARRPRAADPRRRLRARVRAPRLAAREREDDV